MIRGAPRLSGSRSCFPHTSGADVSRQKPESVPPSSSTCRSQRRAGSLPNHRPSPTAAWPLMLRCPLGGMARARGSPELRAQDTTEQFRDWTDEAAGTVPTPRWGPPQPSPHPGCSPSAETDPDPERAGRCCGQSEPLTASPLE